jgi:hypothetical protein
MYTKAPVTKFIITHNVKNLILETFDLKGALVRSNVANNLTVTAATELPGTLVSRPKSYNEWELATNLLNSNVYQYCDHAQTLFSQYVMSAKEARELFMLNGLRMLFSLLTQCATKSNVDAIVSIIKQADKNDWITGD